MSPDCRNYTERRSIVSSCWNSPLSDWIHLCCQTTGTFWCWICFFSRNQDNILNICFYQSMEIYMEKRKKPPSCHIVCNISESSVFCRVIRFCLAFSGRCLLVSHWRRKQKRANYESRRNQSRVCGPAGVTYQRVIIQRRLSLTCSWRRNDVLLMLVSER